MDEKLIYWIIGLVIYYFIQSRKKTSLPPESPESPTPSPTYKPISFEDLLREIESGKPQSEEPRPAPADVPVVNYEEETRRKPEPVLERTDFVYQQESSFEQGRQQAFGRASLEETLKRDDTTAPYTRFKEYETDTRPAYIQSIAKEFEDRENLKKAFIMKEILDRRF